MLGRLYFLRKIPPHSNHTTLLNAIQLWSRGMVTMIRYYGTCIISRVDDFGQGGPTPAGHHDDAKYTCVLALAWVAPQSAVEGLNVILAFTVVVQSVTRLRESE